MNSIDEHPVMKSISSKDEVDVLAGDLADEYIQFFDVNIEQEQERYQDSIEECLAHLEEVISVLDSYKQNSESIDDFVGIVAKRRGSLDRLYIQVDAMEQYIFETNRLLNQLDTFIGDLERHQNAKGGKLQQIIGMIPGVSSMPRIGLFSTLSSFMDDNTTPSFVENQTDHDETQIVPVEDILDQLRQVADSVTEVTQALNKRLYGDVTRAEQAQSNAIESPMANLNLGSTTSNTEHVDGSWQELL